MISFVCLVVILLIISVILIWDSATAHSPCGKEPNTSSQEDTRFSGRCTLAYNFHFILRHPSLELSNSSFTRLVNSPTLPLRKMLVFQGVAHRQTNFTYHLGIQSPLHIASSLFGTQQQLTRPLVKSPTLPLRKMPVFQGVAPWHTISTSYCVIPLWDAATAHLPFW